MWNKILANFYRCVAGWILVTFLALLIWQRAAAGEPQRAVAKPYATPTPLNPYQQPQTLGRISPSVSGQSATTPAEIQSSVHPSVKSLAQGLNWVWSGQSYYSRSNLGHSANAITYSGYAQDRLVDRLIVYTDQNQLRYDKQFVVQYGNALSGDKIVTVQHYHSRSNRFANQPTDDELISTTTYESKVVGSQLYLTSIEWIDRTGAERMRLDITWTSSGVRVLITQGQSPSQDLNLRATQSWLPQHFELWNEFGLNYQP